MVKDFYEILGVPKSASLSQIKQAYRKLARRHHPDVNPGDKASERRFKEISEAYQVLSDPEKRKRYDQFGSFDPGAFTGAAGRGGFGFSGFDFSDLGRKTGFGDIFDEIFSRKRRHRPTTAPRKGNDLQYVVNLSFTDALKGIETEVAVMRREACKACGGGGSILTGDTRACPTCGGTGSRTVQQGALRFDTECQACGGTGIFPGETCRSCRGQGSVPQREKLTVRIPPGVDNGSRVRVAGRGDAGAHGGPPGDLYILTNVAKHPVFTRKGNNIYVTAPVTVTEAALGAKLEVPTIEGSATIRIPPATQSGQRFRLRGRGAKALRGGGRGDQFVEVKIVLPKVIDESTKELYRKLQQQERWNPRKDLFRNL